MNQLALTRLIVAGNRSSRLRLLGIVAGVAVGIGLFLLLAGASQGFGERSERSTWNQLISLDPHYLTAANAQLAADQVAASTLSDHYHDRLITVVSVASTPDSTVRIPGSPMIPAPGEYVASPALVALIDSVPSAELGDRYQTRIAALSADALEGPDSLVLVRGTTEGNLLAAATETEPVIVNEFTGYDYSSQTYRTVAVIGAIAVLIPVLLLIAIVTDLGAAQRAERFAALRLVGATPSQLAGIAAVETAATTLVGAVLGVGLYLLAIPLAARLEVGSSSFYPDDLLVSPAIGVAVVATTVAAATAVAWWRTHRADIGPLGVSRERMEPGPRSWSLSPLVAGIALLAAAVWGPSTGGSGRQTGLIVIGGFVLTTLGLVWAGPLLASGVARAAARGARTPAQVIGFSRIIRHPRAAFQAVAGLVVAVFTVTVFAVAVTAAAGVASVTDGDDRLPTSTIFAQFAGAPTLEEIAAVGELEKVPGVTGTAVGYAGQAGRINLGGRIVLTAADARTLGLVTPPGADFVTVDPIFLTEAPADVQPVSVDPQALQPVFVFVTTDAQQASIERGRTAMITSGLTLAWYPITRTDNITITAAAMENQFAAMAYTGILIAVTLSAVSLAVSTLAAVLNRQRAFGLLHLIGMPRPTLRHLIAYEIAVPVGTALMASIGLGTFTAWCLISALTSRAISWPDPSYYAVLGLCALLIFIAMTATVRASGAITTNASTRYE